MNSSTATRHGHIRDVSPQVSTDTDTRAPPNLDHYLAAWLRIMIFRPGVRFYAYTKEVSRFRRLVEPNPPRNFRWVYSYGGREDHLLDPSRDRVADVYPDEAAIRADGWHSQDSSDLLAVLGPTPVGILCRSESRRCWSDCVAVLIGECRGCACGEAQRLEAHAQYEGQVVRSLRCLCGGVRGDAGQLCG